jgi:hypothetical protein
VVFDSVKGNGTGALIDAGCCAAAEATPSAMLIATAAGSPAKRRRCRDESGIGASSWIAWRKTVRLRVLVAVMQITDQDNWHGQRHATLRLSINLREPFWRYCAFAPTTLLA